MDLHHKGGVTEEIVKKALVGTPLHKRKLIMGMLKKAASGVLALLPCSRTESTLRASKGLRPC